jgi:two-component system CheB/CheR fusion protein
MDVEAEKPESEEAVSENSNELYVVGVGASAGGLEALRELVKNLPRDIPVAYVVVQHMSPDHKSLLAMLIGQEAKLPVLEAVHDVKVESNTIYVTPPKSDVLLKDGRLILQPPSSEPAAPKPSVDRFFISMAEDVGERSVGIVLSGTGSDGAYGVQAIRAAGGITIAQDDKTAKYDGMPIAAIETGCTDLVLSPLQIGTHLAKILKSPRDLSPFRAEEITQHPMSDLLQIVLARTRVDFRDYKSTTVLRRIERRMTALGIAGQQEYTQYCRSNPREVDALFKDLLISVTRFYRDPEEFASLNPIIRQLVDASQDRPLRIWVAACATGEEAYSIAIMFAEAMGGIAELTKERLQIFATDIDRKALDIGRRGRYSRAALDDIPENLVEQYFTVEAEQIVVRERLKSVVLFSEHNICQDPPFLHLDLITCRNVLIYFGVSLQMKVLARLNYSLLRDGYLFLGTAETVSVSEDLFRPISRNSHIYRKRLGTGADNQRLFRHLEAHPISRTIPQIQSREDVAQSSFDREMFDQLAEAIGPDGLLLSDDHRIVRVFGDVSRYLKLNKDSKLQFTFSMLLPELSNEARTLSTVAMRKGEPRRGQTRAIDGDLDHRVQLHAYPLYSPERDEAFALLIISRWRVDENEQHPSGENFEGVAAEQIDNLSNELRSAREELQQTVEELETSNEELQSTNEELQSSNEELQASNEELETANEELQSTNEELVTVNEELQVSTAELNLITEEQQAVLSSISSPMLIIDVALQITKANEAATELFTLRQPVDRPHVSQCKLPQGFPPLAEICSDAMHLGETQARDIVAGDKFYTLECTPFFNQAGQTSGATMIIVASSVASRITAEMQMLYDESPFYVLRWARGGQIISMNEAYAEKLGTSVKSVRSAHLVDVFTPEDGKAIMKLGHALLDGDRAAGRVRMNITPRGEEEPIAMEIAQVGVPASGHETEDSVYSVAVDVTYLTVKQEAQADLIRELEDSLAYENVFMMRLDSDARILEMNQHASRRIGQSVKDLEGKSISDISDLEIAARFAQRCKDFLEGNEASVIFLESAWWREKDQSNVRYLHKWNRLRNYETQTDEVVSISRLVSD